MTDALVAARTLGNTVGTLTNRKDRSTAPLLLRLAGLLAHANEEAQGQLVDGFLSEYDRIRHAPPPTTSQEADSAQQPPRKPTAHDAAHIRDLSRPGMVRPACSCGWAKRTTVSEIVADVLHDQHANTECPARAVAA